MNSVENIKKSLKLYLVTDSEIIGDRDFYKCVEDAIKGGVTTVQLREKEVSGKEFLEKAKKLRKLTRKYSVNFIINDRVDVAMICDADGVHVGQSDINAKEVRKLIGEDKILGVSVRNLKEAQDAKKDGADYIGVGAIFSTTTKVDALLVSFDEVKKIKEKAKIPMVLIGGINLENVNDLKYLESDGYALVSGILKSDEINREVKKWISKI